MVPHMDSGEGETPPHRVNFYGCVAGSENKKKWWKCGGEQELVKFRGKIAKKSLPDSLFPEKNVTFMPPPQLNNPSPLSRPSIFTSPQKFPHRQVCLLFFWTRDVKKPGYRIMFEVVVYCLKKYLPYDFQLKSSETSSS